MRLILLFLLVAAGLVTSAHAEVSTEKVRQHLTASQFALLEEYFETAHLNSIENKDFSELRNVNSVIFNNTHPDHHAKAHAWLEAHPNSPYAAIALAWGHMERAIHYRGGLSGGNTSAESFSAFRRELAQAVQYTDQAVTVAPDYVPALDARIILRQLKADTQDTLEAIEAALKVAPDRHTASLALNATLLRWGGGLMENYAMCTMLAEEIPAYDTELCLIEFVFRNDHQGFLRPRALDALATRDEAFLDYARLDAYLNDWQDKPEAFEEAKRLHRNSLHSGKHPEIYLHELERIHSLFQDPFYKIEAKDALYAHLKSALEDDPHNVDILIALFDEEILRMVTGDRSGNRDIAYEYWQAMLPLGQYRAVVWRAGAGVAEEPADAQGRDRFQELFGNAVYYGKHKPAWTRDYRDSLFQRYRWLMGYYSGSPEKPPKHGEELAARLHCPLFRATRLYELSCETNRNSFTCNPGATSSEYTRVIREMAENDLVCGYMIDAPFESLQFSPVPLSAFVEKPQ